VRHLEKRDQHGSRKERSMRKKPIVPAESKAKYDKWHFSPAVESGGFVFVSGCTGTRPDGTISEDVGVQIRQAFRTVESSLTEAGLTFSDVVEMETYHVGLEEQFQEFVRVKDEFVGEPYPAWTAVGVSELAASGAVVEIKVTARVRSEND
jgi:enamine deaminase RidA (YjgF/YER057c/UK114 family)